MPYYVWTVLAQWPAADRALRCVAYGAASYSFRFGEGTTGIENVEVESASNVIYDLTGRKVNAVERGIYIINGKKVLVK